ncbi:unnamed protein product [Arctogadus glacialis]
MMRERVCCGLRAARLQYTPRPTCAITCAGFQCDLVVLILRRSLETTPSREERSELSDWRALEDQLTNGVTASFLQLPEEKKHKV